MHETPGRVRIKIPTLKRRPTEAERLRNLLGTVEGIRTVTTNSITGSLIVTFDDTTIHSDGIIDILSREDYLDPSKGIYCEQRMSNVVNNVGNVLSKALVGLVVDRALQGTRLAFISALI